MSEANRGGKSRGEGVNTINRGVKSGGGRSIQYNRGGKSWENGANIIQQGCKVYGGSQYKTKEV